MRKLLLTMSAVAALAALPTIASADPDAAVTRLRVRRSVRVSASRSAGRSARPWAPALAAPLARALRNRAIATRW